MTTALVAIEPNNLAEAVDFSERVSKSALLSSALRGKPADVLVAILTGRELGLSPMQSIRGIHVIEGKPTMAADLMVAQCVRRPDICKYFTCRVTNANLATYVTERVGAGVSTLTFTIEQAKTAGLSGKDNWRKYPDAMLRSRCAAALARMVYPDLLAGVYADDELTERATPGAAQEPSVVAEFRRTPVADDDERAAADATALARPAEQAQPEAARPAVALEQQISAAQTIDALTAIRSAVIAAATAGAVSAEEKAALATLFADRKLTLAAAQTQPKAEAA